MSSAAVFQTRVTVSGAIRPALQPVPPATRPDQYVFITPVWGAAYVDRFVKICLPSQLSAGNLGAVPANRVRYLIYTRRDDLRAIRRSPAFRKLKEMVPTSVLSLDDLPDPRFQPHPHQLQTAAYTRGLQYGEGRQTAYVFLTPDLLIADGGYANLIRLAEAGKRVVLIGSVRMATDGAIDCAARFRAAGQPGLTIPPRALVRAGLNHLHPISAGHIVQDGRVRAAQHFYWKVGADGLLVRGFHLHPLLVWPRDPQAGIHNTLDDEYITRACPDRADWYTVTDSDEICQMEFSDPSHKTGMVADRPLSDRDVIRFIRDNTNAGHRELVQQPIRLHASEVEPAAWEPAERQAAGYVGDYLEQYERHGAAESTDLERATHEANPPISGQASLLAGWRKSGDLSFPRLAALALLTPLWVLYRLFNYKLYRYLDRLNAEMIDTRAHLSALRHELHTDLIRLRRIETTGSDFSGKQAPRRPNASQFPARSQTM